MLLSAAITLLKFRLGSRTDADLDTLIPLEMDQAQFELEHSGEPPWFLITEDASATAVAGERRLPVPLDFLLEADEDCLWREEDDGSRSALEKGEYDVSLAYWGVEQGAPAGYALVGQYFHLFPTPDQAYTMWMKYYAADTLPSVIGVGATNLWLTWGQDLLLARTGRRMATYMRDAELVQVFAGEEIAATNRIRVETAAREEANRSRSKGD